MARQLTPTMQAAVDRLRATGQPFRRWPGGWWGTVGSQTRQFQGHEVPVPDWSTGTVRALETRGLIRRTNAKNEWWQDDFVLTAPKAEVAQ